MSIATAYKLQDAGFTKEQVEALGELVETQAATKADLGEVKAELKAEIANVKAEIVDTEHRLDLKIESVKSDLIKWVLGSQLVMAGFILSVLKFFGH